MGDDQPTAASANNGEHAATISREMVKLMRQVAGRGPTKARTTIGRDHVLVMFQDTLTEGERNLVDHGYEQKVLEVRAAYQQILKAGAVQMIERVLGRKVVGFMSTNHFDPDLAAEVFVLDAAETPAAPELQEAEHSQP